MDRKKILDALTKALEQKGKRKFTQSVEIILNFQRLDFSKPENRLNIDVILPKGKGREPKVIVFADGQDALDAKSAGASSVFGSADIPKLAADPVALKKMLKDTEFLAQPKLMVLIGKNLGQILGSRGKLPTPIIGTSVPDAIAQAKRKVKLTTRGKHLPTVQCLIGNENMSPEDLAENAEAVYEAVKNRVTEQNIKSVYVKLTMGKPVKVGG